MFCEYKMEQEFSLNFKSWFLISFKLYKFKVLKIKL
jgi:hypothetical protein